MAKKKKRVRKKAVSKKVVKKRGVKSKAAKKVAKSEINPYAIVGFTIRKLFGYLDYDLPLDGSEREKLGKLAILYGLNGTGKTTILKLAYHMLSPEGHKGHKSYVATIPFQTFGISLLDGTTVFAERADATRGSFSLSVDRPGHGSVSHMFVAVEEPPHIPADRGEEPSYDVVVKALGEVASTFFYLADDRSLNVEYNDPAGGRASVDVGYFESYLQRTRNLREIRREEKESVAVVVGLEAAIHSLNQWFSLQVNRLSSIGFASAHSVYAEVIKQIVSPARLNREMRKVSLLKQMEKLRALALESKIFEKYGLSSKLNVEPLVRIVGEARPSQKYTLWNVLTAYLEALENRFSELRGIYNTIDTLITYLNEFLHPKIVRFNLNEGLTLYAPNNEVLNPSMLSSGERHLLLILCLALLSSNRQAIFIVDEPEISLNIAWQRKLLKSLLSVGAGGRIQFVMASHSMQLISGNLEHVVKLSHQGGKINKNV